MKRKASTIDQPPTKRQRVSNNNNNNNNNVNTHQSNKSKHEEFTINEIEQLLELFNYLQSKNIQNQTLDRCIYEAYLQLFKAFNSNENEKEKEEISSLLKSVHSKVNNEHIIPCCVFFEQLIQIKAQIKGIRLLSRDIKLSLSLSNLCHGINNTFSWQRPYIDPIRNMNPSATKYSKYNLNKYDNNDNDDIIIDNSSQTIEELVYQNEYDGIKKLISRRRMLQTYVDNIELFIKSNNKKIIKNNKYFNIEQYKNAKNELDTLNLMELQNKIRNKILSTRLDTYIYDIDNAENESLLDPNLFVRTAKIGLHFDPHINSANHPPTMATSVTKFPFNYQGQK